MSLTPIRSRMKTEASENDDLLRKKLSRRKAISTAGKVAISAIVAGVVAGVGGYYAGSAAAAPTTVKETVTKTVTAAATTVEKTVTTTVSAPGAATTVTAPAKTVTVTKTVAAPGAKPYEGVKLTVLCHTGVQAGPWHAYKEDIKNILGIDLEVVEAPPEELYSKGLLGIKSKPADYDLVQYNSAWIGDFEPYLLPLDEFIQKSDPGWGDVLPGFRLFRNMWAGKIYSWTLDGDTFMFYYRKDLFDHPDEKEEFKKRYGYELGPPKTWDQVRDIAEFFTRKAGDTLAGSKLKKDFFGYADQAKRGRVYYWYFFRWIPYRAAEEGGIPHYFDPETMKPLINTPASVEALEAMKDILQFSPPGVLGFEWTELFTAAMSDSVVAMWIHWPDEGDRFQDKLQPLPVENPPTPQLGFCPVPGVEKDGKLYRYTPIDTCWELGIAKNSKNPDAAYAVLYFLMRPDNALERVMAPTAKIPSSNHDPYAYSQFYSPRWRAEKPWVGPFLDAELEALKSPYPLLRIPGGFEYLDALDLAVSECLSGAKDAKTALDDAAAKWEEITDRLGRDRQKEFYKKMWMVPLVF